MRAANLNARTNILAVLAALAAAALFCLSPWGRAGDDFAYDSLFLIRGKQAPPPDLVIVAIDEPSFATLKRQWPWPRSLHAKLLHNLFSDGARAVVMDIIFAEPSTPGEDQALAQALRQYGQVVLAADINLITDSSYSQQTLVGPWPGLISAHTRVAFANLPVDDDGFVRRLPLHAGSLKPLALAGAELMGPKPPSDVSAININFLGPSRTITTVSYYQALLPGHLPSGFFKDKLVLVGVVSSSALSARSRPAEHYPTPFSRQGGGYMPGVEIHAQAAHTLMNGASLTRWALIPALALGLILGALSSGVFFRFRPIPGAAVALSVTAALLGAAHLLFSRLIYIPVLALTLPVLAVYLASPFLHYWRAWREKAFIRQAFSSYLAPAVVKKILSHPEGLKLGGESMEATILFADLAGFTSISEKMSPQDLVEMTNRFLGGLSAIIRDGGGMVDKYIGDAVMALWGVPLPQPDHARRACAAALHMQKAMEQLTQQEKRLTGVDLAVRIGISSGRVVAGNVGGDRSFNYTALGSEVNLASRLEGLNKVYGTFILISQNTAGLLGAEFELRPLDRVRVKGQQKPLEIYELQGFADSISQMVRKANQAYAKGLKLYRNNDFALAEDAFSQALSLNHQDGPAQTLLARCRAFAKAPPALDWDGVFTSRTK
ncbi:MAG: adenylate/guanylate cyclase domain-containing protein [Desulfarculaceae bacterium]|jgi:adenylate cyclase